MAVRSSEYYRDPFQGIRGITQGGGLSPRIFNIMVDIIVGHWISLVADNNAITGGFGYMVTYR